MLSYQSNVEDSDAATCIGELKSNYKYEGIAKVKGGIFDPFGGDFGGFDF